MMILVPFIVQAQNIREIIAENPNMSGGKYSSYPTVYGPLTPAPKGYVPFYISHYGRHGSRWHTNMKFYDKALKFFSDADSCGGLTVLGKDVYEKMKLVYEDARDRAGLLTAKGVAEHRGIAERMYRNYPEVFSTKGGRECFIEARSTVYPRCILSMAASNEMLKELNPGIKINREAALRFKYLNNNTAMLALSEQVHDRSKEYRDEYIHPERLLSTIFTPEYAPEVDGSSFMREMFKAASGMQDVDYLGITFYDLFTEEEIFDLFRYENIREYLTMGPSAEFGDPIKNDAKPLLGNIIENADEALATGSHDAFMRFGHDTYLLPLVNLLGLKGLTPRLGKEHLGELHMHWTHCTAVPMASNIQIIFFRSKSSDDILVKVVYNEKERGLPIPTDVYPYYHWSDFRNYCMNLISGAENPSDVNDSLAFVTAPWKVTELEKGATAMNAQIRMFNSVQCVSVVKYPAGKFRTEILHRPGKDSGTVGDIGESVDAVAGINGGYFHVKERYPSVYFRMGEKVYAHTHPTEAYRVDGLMALKGRKLLISKSDTTEYEKIAGKYHTVMASGPLLIEDGEVVVPELMGNSKDGANVAAMEKDKGAKIQTHYSSAQFYDRRHPRAVIGKDDSGNIYYVVIDGRFKGEADGATIHETALICRYLGMTDALNLDGGGSSTLWADETGVINYPRDNKKFDHEGSRTVPNLIVAY